MIRMLNDLRHRSEVDSAKGEDEVAGEAEVGEAVEGEVAVEVVVGDVLGDVERCGRDENYPGSHGYQSA